MLSGTFERDYAVYPMAGLFFVAVFLMLRYPDLHKILENERTFRSSPLTRAVGLILIIAPLFIPQLFDDPMITSTVAVIIVWYGVSLSINPSTLKMLFPYALMFLASVLTPRPLTSLFGGPLAVISSILTESFLKFINVPIVRTDTAFQILRPGDSLNIDISPDCSSIYSITVFLLLCGLMHIDLRKKLAFTLKFATAGTVVLIILNAFRLSTLMWAGYSYGPEALWDLHKWIGYAIFIGFYLVVLVVYLGSSRLTRTTVSRVVDKSVNQ
jgi:exosortase/archaeosortase family protein